MKEEIHLQLSIGIHHEHTGGLCQQHALTKTRRTDNPSSINSQHPGQTPTKTPDQAARSPTIPIRIPIPLLSIPLPMLILPKPLRLPMAIIQRLLATIDMIGTIVARAVLAIVAAARAVSVGSVQVRRRRDVRFGRTLSWVGVFHVEG